MRGLTCLIACLVGGSAAYSQCSSFQPAYPGLNGPVRALGYWTPVGVGPQLPHLVAGGAFTWNEGQGSQDYIAWWDGTAWSNFGWGTDGPVNAITTWDPDGPGPLTPQVVIGGEFIDVGADSTEQVTANHLARWDGEAWRPLGTGADGPVDALLSWDPDGDGPLPAELVAAGRFTHIGGVWTGGVAHWDGVAWHSFGWGIDGSGAALTLWDPDGDGPMGPQLVVGGTFVHAGADSTGEVVANNIARWDGAAWRVLGNGLGHVRGLIAFPLFDTSPSTSLLAADGAPHSWDGTAWTSFAQGLPNQTTWDEMNPCNVMTTVGHILRFVTWDPDGSGLVPPQLYGLGVRTQSQHYCKGGCGSGCGSWSFDNDIVVRWSGAQWEFSLVDSLVPAAGAVAFDPDGAGPMTAALITCGAGTPGFRSLGSLAAPAVALQPFPAFAREGERANFAVEAVNAQTYQWRRRVQVCQWIYPCWNCLPVYDCQLVFVPLVDGAGQGGVISGATTPRLTVTGVVPGDAALYDCLVSNACATIPSQAVALTVLPGSCTADYNHDGDSGTDQDVEAFFACLAGTCCPMCGDADFNGDGDVGTDQDIESFFRVLGGGAC